MYSKQRFKLYIVLITVLFAASYFASQHFVGKVEEEVEIYNQRIAVLYNAQRVIYHMTAIQEGLHGLNAGLHDTPDPVKEHFQDLDEAMKNLSAGVSYIFYTGKDDDTFKAYSHHIEVMEMIYPRFVDEVNKALSVEDAGERKVALKEAIVKGHGLKVLLNEMEKLLYNDYKEKGGVLPSILKKMGLIKNITGFLLFAGIGIFSFLLFYSCKVYGKISPFIQSIMKGDYSCKAEVDEEGCGREIVSVINLMAQRMAENEKLSQSVSIADPLTGAYNRRYFDMRIDEEMNRCIRYGTIFSLSLVDIDNFKEINDTFGHQAGDVVLKELVLLIKEHSRETDIMARYGGEEFVIIYPCTPKSGVLSQIERLREMVESHKFLDLDRPVTISIGAADSAGKQHPDQVIQEADANLYMAKRGGRNRCVISGVTA